MIGSDSGHIRQYRFNCYSSTGYPSNWRNIGLKNSLRLHPTRSKEGFLLRKKNRRIFLTKNRRIFFSRKKILSSVSNTGYNTTVATLYAYSIFIFQGQAKLESVPFQLAPPLLLSGRSQLRKSPIFNSAPPLSSLQGYSPKLRTVQSYIGAFLSPRLLT